MRAAQTALILTLGGWLLSPARGATTSPSQPTSARSSASTAAVIQRTDVFGDTLPHYAVARLGTTRFTAGTYFDSVAFSPDCKLLVSAHGDDGVHVWDAATGRRLRSIAARDAAQLVAFAGNDVIVCAWSNLGVVCHDALSGKQLRVLCEGGPRASRVEDVVASADGRRLVVRTIENVTLWDPVKGEQVRELSSGRGYPSRSLGGVSFSADGKTLMTIGPDRLVMLWDAIEGRVRPAPVIKTTRGSAALSPDAKTIAVGGPEVRLFDVEGGGELPRPRWQANPPDGLQVEFAPVGSRLAVVGGDHVKFWDVARGAELPSRSVRTDNMRAVRWSPDGERIAMPVQATQLIVWDVLRSRSVPAETPISGGSGVNRVCVMADGAEVATGDFSGNVARWDAATGRLLKTRATSYGSVQLLFAPADGEHLEIVASSGQSCRLKTDSLDEVRSTKEFGGWGQLAITGDGRYVARSSKEGLTVRDRETGTDVSQFSPVGVFAPAAVAFSPDRETLAVASDGRVRLFDVAAGRPRKLVLDSPWSSSSRQLRYSPDGGRIVSVDQFGVSLWELPEVGDLWRTKLGDGMSMAISPDGLMVAASDGKEIVLLEASTGGEIARLRGHETYIHSLEFFPDGSRLVSGSSDSTAIVWDVMASIASSAEPTIDPRIAWKRLATDTAARAYPAMAALVASHAGFVLAHATDALPPAPGGTAAAGDRDQHDRWIADLSSRDRPTRERAHLSLERAGAAAAPAVSAAMRNPPTGEGGDRLRAIAKLIGAAAAAPPSNPTPGPASDEEASAQRKARGQVFSAEPRMDLRVAQMLSWLARGGRPQAAQADRLLGRYRDAEDGKLRCAAQVNRRNPSTRPSSVPAGKPVLP
jgi:WD40 repeat protein